MKKAEGPCFETGATWVLRAVFQLVCHHRRCHDETVGANVHFVRDKTGFDVKARGQKTHSWH